MQRHSDIVLAFFVVAITVMLLIPLPTIILDFLLAANISFALLMLLVGLYMPNALALLAFPSLLLLTTLFRLGLNVASTRLILSNGDAGRVIEAFGTFLIRGEILVGLIIFVIITIVNFIVIARGSSRVSEVAARFALDSLPGKQMAIDSDLRSGLISAEQAQMRREDLRKESQLYGSMDGAMRFVQGDAIAGLFIIVTNIVGGMYLGISNGMSFSEAGETYTTLTVGDGLVSQIPALFISICAGIVVTRVASGENTTLGADVGRQIFARPAALVFAGGLAALIAVLPGIPTLPFLVMGLLLGGAGFWSLRSAREFAPDLPLRRELGTNLSPTTWALPAGGEDRGIDAPLVLHLDASVLHRLYKLNSQRYRVFWSELQADVAQSQGIRLPELVVSADTHCAPAHFAFSVNGSVAGNGFVVLDGILVETNPKQAAALGLEVALEVDHPVSNERVFWTPQSPAVRKVLEAGDIRAFDFFEYIAMQVAAFFVTHPEEVLNLTEVHGMLKTLEKRYPGLIADALNKEYLNISRLTDILQELVRQGISIRDFKGIIEAIAAYCSSYGARLSEEDGFDLQDVVSSIRQSRKRHLLSKLKGLRGLLKVFTLSPEVEDLLETGVSAESGQVSLGPEDLERLRSGLRSILGSVRGSGLTPVAILCRADLLGRVVHFLRHEKVVTPVVTFDELAGDSKVEPIAEWSV